MKLSCWLGLVVQQYKLLQHCQGPHRDCLAVSCRQQIIPGSNAYSN
jgi:hypothetical protein